MSSEVSPSQINWELRGTNIDSQLRALLRAIGTMDAERFRPACICAGIVHDMSGKALAIPTRSFEASRFPTCPQAGTRNGFGSVIDTTKKVAIEKGEVA